VQSWNEPAGNFISRGSKVEDDNADMRYTPCQQKAFMQLHYSTAVISGLQKIGFDLNRLQEGGIPAHRLQKMIDGRSEFTVREIAIVERLSGFTGGQLAARTTEPNGGPLTNLMNSWAVIAKLAPDNARSAMHGVKSNGRKSNSVHKPKRRPVIRIGDKSKKARPVVADH
jgi:hypothetical protein